MDQLERLLGPDFMAVLIVVTNAIAVPFLHCNQQVCLAHPLIS